MSSERKIFEEFLKDNPRLTELPVWEAYEILLESCIRGGKVLTCGNGGSASDSAHIVGELMKGFRLSRKLDEQEQSIFSKMEGGAYLAEHLQRGIPAISLCSEDALLTAVGNDTAYRMVFAQQVYGYGVEGDVLIAMSTSGNSGNVVNAAKTAKALNMKVIGITGDADSQLEKYSDICLRMPAKETYRIQEYTLPVYHALCAMLEEKMFG
ncbi:MAG: SIS domain-containing protein [Clostridiales bacterium]|nr:SIS domain-containing protein [Clostridiales bacterium]